MFIAQESSQIFKHLNFFINGLTNYIGFINTLSNGLYLIAFIIIKFIGFIITLYIYIYYYDLWNKLPWFVMAALFIILILNLFEFELIIKKFAFLNQSRLHKKKKN